MTPLYRRLQHDARRGRAESTGNDGGEIDSDRCEIFFSTAGRMSEA
jgi:hypothetical protein